MSDVKARKKYATLLDYRATFLANPRGQKVLWDLMKEHYVLGSTFSPEANSMAFFEGQRNVVLGILNILKIDPNKFLETIEKREHEDKQNLQP